MNDFQYQLTEISFPLSILLTSGFSGWAVSGASGRPTDIVSHNFSVCDHESRYTDSLFLSQLVKM